MAKIDTPKKAKAKPPAAVKTAKAGAFTAEEGAQARDETMMPRRRREALGQAATASEAKKG